MRLLLACLAVSGCTWVSDAQYDDRVEELEAARVEFLPAADEVQFLVAAGNKVFWIDRIPPAEDLIMKSFDTVTNNQATIQTTQLSTSTDFLDRFRFSNAAVLDCDANHTAWDANTGVMIGTPLPSQTEGVNTFLCALDGNRITTVDTMGSDTDSFVYQWTVGTTPVRGLNLTAAGVGDGSSAGIAVRDNHMVYTEAGNIWHVDIAAGTATWLMNDDLPAIPPLVVDASAAMYDTNEGVKYERYVDSQIQPFDLLLKDGGYRLNSSHSEIHQIDDDGIYMFYKHYIIYRGQSGVFAYDRDNQRVIDLLLDRSDRSAVYRSPVITDSGVLFVQHRDDFNDRGLRPVYRVDLAERLP